MCVIVSAAFLAVVCGIALIGIGDSAGASAKPAYTAAQTLLTGDLVQTWKTVFQTPSPQNPFGNGGPSSGCLDLGRTLAPFGPTGVSQCSTNVGTKVFVIASSFECSTIEGNGTTAAELTACAKQSDAPSAPAVTVDGVPVVAAESVTGPFTVTLPVDNIFGLPAGTSGTSVAHGWVLLMPPPTPGLHKIVIDAAGGPITTNVNVQVNAT
jgi:hypothetical protein